MHESIFNKELGIKFLRLCSFVLTVAYIINIALNPRWLNPIELFLISILLFFSISQGKELIIRFLPFVVLVMVYEAFRGVADNLNTRVGYQWLIDADRALFGEIPTIILQDWLWSGAANWFDALLYGNYMLHFVVPWALAIIIWKKRDEYYWRYMTSIIVLSYMGFITFLIIPSSPPWLASNEGYLPELADIVGSVWSKLSLTSTPEQIQIKIAPNPVAAVPSLHAGYATLIVIYSISVFKSKLKYISLLYFAGIIFGSMYLTQHYFIDLIIGIFYAVAAFYLVNKNKYLLRAVSWAEDFSSKLLNR